MHFCETQIHAETPKSILTTSIVSQ